MDSCRGGKVHVGPTSVGVGAAMRHGGGEIGALSHRCSLLLEGAPVMATMKGPRQLHRRCPDMGEEVMTKGSQHDGSDGDGALAMAASAPVASLMAVQRWQHSRETKILQSDSS
jgi:hypothetical protein